MKKNSLLFLSIIFSSALYSSDTSISNDDNSNDTLINRYNTIVSNITQLIAWKNIKKIYISDLENHIDTISLKFNNISNGSILFKQYRKCLEELQQMCSASIDNNNPKILVINKKKLRKKIKKKKRINIINTYLSCFDIGDKIYTQDIDVIEQVVRQNVQVQARVETIPYIMQSLNLENQRESQQIEVDVNVFITDTSSIQTYSDSEDFKEKQYSGFNNE